MQKEPEITSAKAVLIKPNVDATMEANMKVIFHLSETHA